MHKAYYSVKPCQNKLLKMRWDLQDKKEHSNKIAEAKPMVNTKAPQTYTHLHLKLKKIKLDQERLHIIERDNRLLLEKMSHIMRTRGRLDNVNNYDPKSLNREKRQRELLRVTHENQGIIDRITQCKANYNQQKLKREWHRNLTFLDNISHFPMDWWSRKKDRKQSKSAKSDTNEANDEKKDHSEKASVAEE